MERSSLFCFFAVGIVTLFISGCNCCNSMTDADITTNLQAQLAADRALYYQNIHIDTYDRIVTLTGMVENPTQACIVYELANSIPCVRFIVPQLTIKRFTKKPGGWLG